MFVRWQRNVTGKAFGAILYVFGKDFWRFDVCLLSHVLSFGRSYFYTRRKKIIFDGKDVLGKEKGAS